jgi:myo-inositol 2-dehydrogenase / D-chiro-inositol 1-dehydrogenase
MTLNLALIGGRIAKVHAGAIGASTSARLAAVADAIPAAASALASQWGCDTKTVAEIAADPAIIAVLVCTPTDTHADLIERFAKAGKHVFCEKSVDLDSTAPNRFVDRQAG